MTLLFLAFCWFLWTVCPVWYWLRLRKTDAEAGAMAAFIFVFAGPGLVWLTGVAVITTHLVWQLQEADRLLFGR